MNDIIKSNGNEQHIPKVEKFINNIIKKLERILLKEAQSNGSL